MKGKQYFYVLLLLPTSFLLFLGCSSLHEKEQEEREHDRLTARLRQVGSVIEHEGLLFAPEQGAISQELVEGDILYIRYTLYALTGSSAGEIALESNEAEVIEKEGLHSETALSLQRYVLGSRNWLEGIDRGIQYFAPTYSKGWLGIPFRHGYGNRPFGRIAGQTPLLFHYEIIKKEKP